MKSLLFIQSDAVQTAIETADAAAGTGVERITLWNMAMNGGWIMIILALLLILALYIFIERYLTLSAALKGQEDNVFMDNIRGYVHEGNLDEARNLAKQTDTPLGRMINKGFSRLGRPLPDIQAAIENEGKLEVANLEKRVSLVATVASLGPMLGFLGTVTGMIPPSRTWLTLATISASRHSLAVFPQLWLPLLAASSWVSSAISSTTCWSPVSIRSSLNSRFVPMNSWTSCMNPHNNVKGLPK